MMEPFTHPKGRLQGFPGAEWGTGARWDSGPRRSQRRDLQVNHELASSSQTGQECDRSLEPLFLNGVAFFESWAFYLESGVTCLPVRVCPEVSSS